MFFVLRFFVVFSICFSYSFCEKWGPTIPSNVPALINDPSPIASPPTLQEEYLSGESFTSNKPDEENFGPSPTDQPVTELGNISNSINFYKNDKDEVVYDQDEYIEVELPAKLRALLNITSNQIAEDYNYGSLRQAEVPVAPVAAVVPAVVPPVVAAAEVAAVPAVPAVLAAEEVAIAPVVAAAAPVVPVAAAPAAPPFNPISLLVSRIPCACTNGVCGCCTGMLLQTFNSKGCMNITYIPEEFAFDLKMSMNDRVLYKNRVSGRNPAPVCIRPPRFQFIEVCASFYDIHFIGRNMHICLEMGGYFEGFELFSRSFNCMRLGDQGVKLVKPEDGGGLPQRPFDDGDGENNGDDDSDEEDYDELLVRRRSVNFRNKGNLIRV